MALLNIFNIGAAAFYIYLFIVLRRMRIQEREHKILSLAVIALFQWTITAYFVYNGEDIETLRVLLPLSCIGMFFFFPLNLHFAYSIVIDQPLPKPYFIVLYSIAAGLSIVQFFHPISMKVLEEAGGTVVLTAAVDSPLSPVWTIYALSCWLIPAWLYIRYRRKAGLNRQQKQANLLIRITCIMIILVMGEYYLVPLIPGWKIPSQSPILFSIWMGGVVYAIWKYGFLRISPRALENKILDSVEDLVILYSIDGKAVYRNRKALEVLGSPKIPPTKATEIKGVESAVIHGGAEGGENLIKEKAVAPLLRDRATWGTNQPEN